MFKDDGKWYRGNDLMEVQQKLLFQNFIETVRKQQGEIAYVLAYIENNSERYHSVKRTLEALQAHKEDPYKIEVAQQYCDIINSIQHNLLLHLQPLFHELFDKVADKTPPGLGYNEALRDEIWFNLIFGERDLSGPIDGSRDTYRENTIHSTRPQRYEKMMQKYLEKRKQEREKVRLPQDHRILNEDAYPRLKKTMWTHLDKIVSTYQQKFLKDTKNANQVKELVDHYFLFMFLQMLIQSKVVFDTKKPKSYPFFQQVLDDCLSYLQKKYSVSLTITSESIKKKFFSTINETTKPLELIYKNCMEEDLLAWENYFNTYFFEPKKVSVDDIRRKIMVERRQNVEKMNRGWEALNPLYHIAKEKKEKIITTIGILEIHASENNLIGDLLSQLQDNLKKAEEDMKNNVVFEEDHMTPKDPDSLVKLSQQYLKFYKVPVQYRKVFGLVINRLNHFYQIKSHLVKKVNEHNAQAFDQLIYSDRKIKDILYYIGDLINQTTISTMFDEKWTNKQTVKIERIQSFCAGTKDITTLPEKKRIKNEEGQFFLNL